MTSVRNILLALLSVLTFINISVSTDHDLTGNDVVPQLEPCGAPATGCDSCGSEYSGCGDSSCFNPSVGEICCDDNYVCPMSHNCGQIQGACHPATLTIVSTTISTTATMTVTSTHYGAPPARPVTDDAPPAPSTSCPPTLPVQEPPVLPEMQATSFAPPVYSPLIPLPPENSSASIPQTNDTALLTPTIPSLTSSELTLRTSPTTGTLTSDASSVHTTQTTTPASSVSSSTSAPPTSNSARSLHISHSLPLSAFLAMTVAHITLIMEWGARSRFI